jgi:hypothetical protein
MGQDFEIQKYLASTYKQNAKREPPQTTPKNCKPWGQRDRGRYLKRDLEE